MDEEAKLADREGKGFLLQGDLNSWLGSDIIANDPRPQNNNGKRFSTFLQYNNLTLVNASKSCKGLITRSRTTKEGKVQKSIIDFFVVCNRLLPYVTDTIIDNQRNYTITNYRGSKRGRRAVDSDHVTLILNLNLNVLPQKPQRVEMLDFKNLEGQALFKRKTPDTSEFTECFQNMLPLQEQCEKWFQKLKTHCKKSFPIIRIRSNNIKSSEADHLIIQRNKLKLDIEEGKSKDLVKLQKLELEIESIIEDEQNNKAKLFKQFCNESSSINITEMWKLKKTIWPNIKDSLPAAKLNNQ